MDLTGPLHINECCWSNKMRKQIKKPEKLTNSDLVLCRKESSLFLHDVMYSNPWQGAPQEYFHLCIKGKWMGKEVAGQCQWQPDLICNHAVDLPNSISLGYDYTVVGLRVKEQHASCSRKPERQELERQELKICIWKEN